MEWKNRSGISLICLIFFIILLIIIRIFYINSTEYQLQIILILTEAVLSVPITLILIEWVIKRDREKQWEKVRLLTFETILFNILNAAYLLPISIPFYIENESKKFFDIILKGKPNPLDPQVRDEISEYAKTIRTIQNQLLKEERERLGEDKWDEKMALYSEMILKYHQEVHWLLEDVRLILIPRVLQLSDDQEVNLALLDFENYIRSFEYAIIEQLRSEKGLPVADLAIADLLAAIGTLCGILQEKYNFYKSL